MDDMLVTTNLQYPSVEASPRPPVFELSVQGADVEVSHPGTHVEVALSGPQGRPGADGPPGTTYTHTQSIALSVWTVLHNLGRYMSVTVVDDAGNKVEPDVTYVSINEIRITHGAAMTGRAFLN